MVDNSAVQVLYENLIEDLADSVHRDPMVRQLWFEDARRLKEMGAWKTYAILLRKQREYASHTSRVLRPSRRSLR